MTPEEVVRHAESGDMRPLRSQLALFGVSQAYFLRVAALLGTDPSAARKLGRRWQSFLKHGDEPGYVWRARGGALRGAGRWKESADAFVRAGQEARTSLDKSVFQLGAIDSFARAGYYSEAESLGRELAARLTELKESVPAARARLNLANALIWSDRYRDAEAEYRAALLALETPYEVASSHLGLSTTLLHGGDPSEAARHAREAIAGFQEIGMSFYAALASVNLAHADLLCGRPEDAWAGLMNAREAMSESPPDKARLNEFLGDTYFALSLFEDSIESYEEALVGNRGMPLNRANSWFGIGLVKVAVGDLVEAQRAFGKASRAYKRIGNRVWELAALGEMAQLRQDVKGLVDVAHSLRELGARYWSARVALQAGLLGQPEELEAAILEIDQFGFDGLRWRCDWARARLSGSLDDYRSMATRILEERILTRSTSARLSFMRDKSVAMRELFSLLIDAGTEESRLEALDLLRRTRSASLIDEVLASPASQEVRKNLEALREEIGPESPDSGTESRYRKPEVHLRRRSLVSATLRDIREYAERVTSTVTADGTWIELGERCVSLTPQKMGIHRSECIKKQLRWLLYEMMAPLLDRGAKADVCLELAESLKAELGSADHHTICPDGILWQVPWALAVNCEPTVLMNPDGRDPRHDRLQANPSVTIWFQESAELPHIRAEVASIVARFPKAILCKSAESVRQQLASGTHFDHVHIATHAEFQTSNPMFAHFSFTDGAIYAFEVAHSSFTVGSAVLAACNTGQMSPDIPDEPNGFARAFLARGATAVVAGLWPLDDEAAFVTMRTLYTRMQAGDTWGEGLATARRECRARLPHPYFWAGLMLFGGVSHA